MAEYIKKEDLLDEAYWHGRYTVQNSYLTGAEAVDVEDIEKMKTINIVKCKDCIYHIYDEDSCCYWCEHPFMAGIVKPNFYCACGQEWKL